jgi:hypothetical protein
MIAGLATVPTAADSEPNQRGRAARGGLDARLDVLARYGIAVHRVLGEHPAVHRANHRLGYL